MEHNPDGRMNSASSIEGSSAEVAMKAVARLFARSSTSNSLQEGINPRDVLLGLSAFFKAVAKASESDSIEDVELGLCNLDSQWGTAFPNHQINTKTMQHRCSHRNKWFPLINPILVLWMSRAKRLLPLVPVIPMSDRSATTLR